jgi:hypothetical protein
MFTGMVTRAAVRGTVRSTRTGRSHPKAAQGRCIRREVAARKAAASNAARLADLQAQIAALDAKAAALAPMARLRYQVLTGQF